MNAIVKLVVLLGLIGAGGWLVRAGGVTPLPSSLPARAAGPRQAPAAPKKEESPFRMTGTVRVEGTGEPVAGARVQVDLGTRDLSGDFREAVTGPDGRYTIALPEGNARPLFFTPPPGYWLPDAASHWKFFAVTPQQPVYRKDFELRRGTTWTFRLTRGPKHEPVVPGFVSTYHLPGEFDVFVRGKTDPRGYAAVTLPDEAARLTISLQAQDEGRALVKLNWPRGFRPGAVKEVKQSKRLDEGGETDFRVTDEAGGTATISGPVEPSIQEEKLILSTTLPAVDPGAFGSVTGTVIDKDGRPIAEANVTIYHNYRQWGTISSSAEHRVRTDAQGRYSLRAVPRKSYEGDPAKLSIVVYKDGYAGRESDIFEFKPRDDGSQAVDPIRLAPGLSLSGRVVDPDGRPVVGAQIRTVGSWAESAYTYRSGPDGRFTIPNLNRGVVRAVFTFGQLDGAGSYVVDGQAQPVTIQLHPVPARPATPRPAARPAPAQPLKIGEIAPNWVVRGWTDGKDRSIGELRGRVVCLDFWNLQAGELTLPAFDRLRQKFEPRGVVFLSIHTPDGSLDQIRKLYALKDVSLVSAVDAGPGDHVGEGATARMYGVRGFPWGYVIDRSGKVAFNTNDPANRGAMAAIVQKLGIDANKQPTEDQMSQVMEGFLGEAIDKVLARP